jgi:protein KTI12
MALVTISGFPCSGKTTRAKQIKAEFERRLAAPEYKGPSYRVVIVDDEGSNVSREAYDSECRRSDSELTIGSLAEKPARASLFANVLREMRDDTILLCDSLNYIKGFRYQMYCAAREANMRVCTVRSSIVWR